MTLAAHGDCVSGLNASGDTLTVKLDQNFWVPTSYQGNTFGGFGDGCNRIYYVDVRTFGASSVGVTLEFSSSGCNTLLPACGEGSSAWFAGYNHSNDLGAALQALADDIESKVGYEVFISVAGNFGDSSLCFTLTCSQDSDGDGVLDADDGCDGTAPGDVVDANGCSITQYCPCDGEYKNHGQYMKCIVQISKAFLGFGLITKAEQSAVVSAAAQSGCGK